MFGKKKLSLDSAPPWTEQIKELWLYGEGSPRDRRSGPSEIGFNLGMAQEAILKDAEVNGEVLNIIGRDGSHPVVLTDQTITDWRVDRKTGEVKKSNAFRLSEVSAVPISNKHTGELTHARFMTPNAQHLFAAGDVKAFYETVAMSVDREEWDTISRCLASIQYLAEQSNPYSQAEATQPVEPTRAFAQYSGPTRDLLVHLAQDPELRNELVRKAEIGVPSEDLATLLLVRNVTVVDVNWGEVRAELLKPQR